MTRSFGGEPNSPQSDQSKVHLVRVDFGKRLVAIIIDLAAAYLLSMIVNLVPFLGVVAASQAAMVLFLICRDYFFQGRGIGKNLMGLQVVDVRSGLPCSFWQAVKRNIVIYGPVLLVLLVAVVLGVVNSINHLPQLVNNGIYNVLGTLSTIYVLFAIPYEAYRVYSRADGRRFGDQWAGTSVVEAPMDFSTPVPRG